MAQSVLIVDDDDMIRDALRFAMEGEGYDVATAADGEEALSMVERIGPDIMLLDVTMPRRDGYDVCQTIRSMPDLRSVKIIMLSAKGRCIDVEKGLAIGADDYMTKPFSTRALAIKVRTMLDAAGAGHG